MKKTLHVIISIVLSLIIIGLQSYVTEANRQEFDYVHDEIIIGFKDISEFPGKEHQYNQEQNKILKDGFSYHEIKPNVYVINVGDLTRNPNAVLNRYKNSQFIEYVELNHLGYIELIPNDANYKNTGSVQANVIKAEAGWDIISQSRVPVAIIDTGLGKNNDLPIIKTWNVTNNTTDATDNNGHGTKVTGVIGAIGNNKTGNTGIVWDANIMQVKASDTATFSSSNVAAAINWASNNGARVINISIGFTADNTTIRNSINSAYNQGVIIVASSGNNGTEPVLYPAAYPNVLGVGGTSDGKVRNVNSSYGSGLDILANFTWNTTTNTNTYTNVSGTSIAAPQVAGLAALVWELAPNLTNTQVMQLIRDNTNRADGKWDSQTGYGTIDMGRTLAAAKALGGKVEAPVQTPATPPVLTLLGNTRVELVAGDSYVEAGFTAKDSTGTDITNLVKITNEPKTAFAGTYIVTYTVTDRVGLTTTATRTVVVKEAPVVTPEVAKVPTISPIGSNPIILHLGSLTAYTEQGARAIDEKDGDISNNVKIEGTVDRNKAGTYTIKYTVTNSSGLTASTSRNVVVLAPDTVNEPQQVYTFNEQAKKGDKPLVRPIQVNNDGTVTLSIEGLNKFSVLVSIIDSAGRQVFQENFSANVSRQLNLAAGAYTVTSEVSDGSGNNKYTIKAALPVVSTQNFAQPEVPLAPGLTDTIPRYQVWLGVAILLLIGSGTALYLKKRYN